MVNTLMMFQKRYKTWRVRLIALVAIATIVLIFASNVIVRLVATIAIPVCIGILVIFYIRKTDAHDMQSSRSLIPPLLALVLSSLSLWYLIVVLNSTLPKPILADFMNPDASQIILASTVSIIWAYLCINIPYSLQLSLFRQDTVISVSENFEQRITDLGLRIDGLKSEANPQKAMQGLLSEMKLLLDELKSNSEGIRTGMAPLRLLDQISPFAAFLLTILTTLVAEGVKRWVFPK